jgi:hypothetical protein
VNDAFVLPNLPERVRTSFQLLLDVLELVPPAIDVSKEIRRVREALDPEKLLSERMDEKSPENLLEV